MRKQIWLAIIVCAIAIVPSFFLGGVAMLIWKAMVGWQIGPEPDFYMMRTLFGFEAPSNILQWIVYSAIPSFFQGMIAGYVALYATDWIYRGRNIEIAAYAAGALYTGALLVMLALALSNAGMKLTFFEAILQLIGLWTGLIISAQSAPNASLTKSST